MENDNEKVLGSVRISDEVVAICCMNAILKTNGVSRLAGGFMGNLQKNILGNTPALQGIKLNRDDETVSFDIFIIVDYDVKIPQVAWDVQVNVKNEVEDITGLRVNEVNIHVQGVDMKTEEE